MQVVHRVPTGLVDKLALYTVKVMRTCFDVLSGYKLKNWRGTLSEKCVQNRYRTAQYRVAAVPIFGEALLSSSSVRSMFFKGLLG